MSQICREIGAKYLLTERSEKEVPYLPTYLPTYLATYQPTYLGGKILEKQFAPKSSLATFPNKK